MRASVLLTVGVLLLSSASARAQPEEPTPAVEGDFLEPGWFGVSTESPTSWPLRFAAEGSGFHVTTGAVTAAYFHNPEATNDPVEIPRNYTVKATFHERSTAAGENPQPYGVAIGGDRDDAQAYAFLYCAAYGNGTFDVGGAGPGLKPFRMNAAGPAPHPAVHKVTAAGSGATQEIALSVRDGDVSCAINGVVIASYEHVAVGGPGRFATTNGFYGVYLGRNLDVEITGLTVTTP